MTTLDYVVLILYLLAVVAVGVGLSAKVKSSGDLFAAGGRSPWWASGLSGFMTMFSSATFVVWGGIAYERGVVAISINLCYGFAALLVGYFVAGRWNRLRIGTPAEYVELRFGRGALHAYAWIMMFIRLSGTAVALYALAVMLTTLMPLSEGAPFRDPETGNASMTAAIIGFGGVVVLYTMFGGLWAVLMTDVLQFIVLTLVVVFMVPVMLGEVGGLTALGERLPEGFLSPIAGDFTWFFLCGWIAIHFFVIGAELAFVQRFLCVPGAKDAKKSAYLFGLLYLVSPMLWLFPPLAYRAIDPNAAKEQAYVLACQHVLPAGMVGLMIAAMFSATASMVSSQLNVFAGVLTEDVVRRLAPGMSARSLLRVGRVISGALGVLIVGFALAVPSFGGAEAIVLAVASLAIVPLLAPMLFGLLNRRISVKAVWFTLAVSYVAVGLVVSAFAEPIADAGWKRAVDVLVGVVLPCCVLTGFVFASRSEDPGSARLDAVTSGEDDAQSVASSDPVAARIVASALMVLAVLLIGLSFTSPEHRALMLVLAAVLAGAGVLIRQFARRAVAHAVS